MSKKITLLGLGATTIILAIIVVVIHSNSMMMSRSASTSTIVSAASTNSVNVQDYMFVPMAIKVKVGTTVTWTNKDSVHHSITADNVASNAPDGPLIGQGEKYSFRFTKAGTYTFHCMPHPYMHGTVIVTS